MTDFPEYTIRPNAVRLVTGHFLLMLLLAFLFYAGIAINVSLLQIEIPSNIQVLIISVLVLLIIIQELIIYMQTAKTQFFVYRNRIQLKEDKYIMFNDIEDLKVKKDFFDKLFGTGTIIIGKTKLKAIPNFDQTYNYLKQLIQYSRTQYIQQG